MTQEPAAPETSNLLIINDKNADEAAAILAGNGFTILPLPHNKKQPPLLSGWQHWTQSNPQKVVESRKHLSDSAQPDTRLNLGIATGSCFLVLDFDKHKGGCESLNRLLSIDEKLPSTFQVSTPSGGGHLYYRTTDAFTIGVDVLDHVGYPGVDLRARGGYVCAPGSTIDGKRYMVLNSLPMADAPAWLIDALQSRKQIEKAEQTPVAETDSEEGMLLAKTWLLNEAPEAIEGAGGDSTTYLVAARMRDYALSEGQALEHLLDYWNDEKALPPWLPEDLQIKVRNAYHSGTATPGIAIARLAHHEFTPLPQSMVDLFDKKPDSRERAPIDPNKLIERRHEVTSPKTQWLVDGILPQKSFGVLYGQPGSFKSFVALHLADMIASNKPFLGKNTRIPNAQVLYLAAEGGHGLRQRLDASTTLHGSVPDRIGFIRHVLNLRSSRADADILLNAIKLGQWKPNLIIIDTLARSFSGGNENSSEDMGAFIDTVDYLRDKSDAAILAVHHSGKDTTRGTRGHSSLFGAVDSEFEVKSVRPAPETGPGQGAGSFSITKQKDGPDGWNVDFVAEKVLFPRESAYKPAEDDQGAWADGEDQERSSLAVRAYRPGEVRVVSVEEVKLSMAAHAALAVLQGLCDRNGDRTYMHNWRRALVDAGVIDESSASWATLRREMKATGCYSTSLDRHVSVASMFKRIAVAPDNGGE